MKKFTQKIAILALLLGGLVIFTAVLAVVGSGMPLNEVKTYQSSSNNPATTSDPANNAGSTGSTNNTSSPSNNTTPTTNSGSGESWNDGWSGHWDLCMG